MAPMTGEGLVPGATVFALVAVDPHTGRTFQEGAGVMASQLSRWAAFESEPRCLAYLNFLLKIGRRPGVPMHLDLTQAELSAGVHDTNKRWTTAAGRQPGVQRLTPSGTTPAADRSSGTAAGPVGPLHIDLTAPAQSAA